MDLVALIFVLFTLVGIVEGQNQWGWYESDVPKGIDQTYQQLESSTELKWSNCKFNYTEDGHEYTSKMLECAMFKVPLDWNNPDATYKTVTASGGNLTWHGDWKYVMLPLVRDVGNMTHHNDKGGKKGMVLVHGYGGPGNFPTDGLRMVIHPNRLKRVRAAIGDDYDLIGFDHRGYGNSRPAMTCNPEKTQYHFPTRKEKDAAEDAYSFAKSKLEEYTQLELLNDIDFEMHRAEACGKVVGNFSFHIAHHMSSLNIAKDMIAIADAYDKSVGKEPGGPVNFFTMSYATYFGMVFAAEYPERVGKFVLDGVVDPVTILQKSEPFNVSKAADSFYTLLQSCGIADKDDCPARDIPYELDEVKYWWAKLMRTTSNQTLGEAFPIKGFWNALQDAFLHKYKAFERLMNDTKFPFLNCKYHHNAWNIDWAISAGLIQQPWKEAKNFAWDIHLLEKGHKCAFDEEFNGTRLQQTNWLQHPSSDQWTILLCNDGPNLHLKENMAYAWNTVYNRMSFSNIDMGNSVFHLFGCINWQVQDADRFEGPFQENLTTKTPILMIGNELDPLTPLLNAYKVQKFFANSAIIPVNSVGHTAFLSKRSKHYDDCVAPLIWSYFNSDKTPKSDLYKDGTLMYLCEATTYLAYDDSIAGIVSIPKFSLYLMVLVGVVFIFGF